LKAPYAPCAPRGLRPIWLLGLTLLCLHASAGRSHGSAANAVDYPAATGRVSAVDAMGGVLSFSSLQLGLGLAATTSSGPAKLVSVADAFFSGEVVGAGPGVNVVAGTNAAGTWQIRVLDTGNLLAPQVLGHLALVDLAIVTDVTIDAAGTTVYLAVGDKGLVTVDISDRANPTRTQSQQTPGYAWAVALEGTRLFLARGIEGLGVYDAASLAPLGNFQPGGSIRDVAVAGSITYLLDQQGQLFVADAANPGAIRFLSSAPLLGFGKTMSLEGTTLAAIVSFDQDECLRIFDVGNPSQPELVTSHRLYGPGSALDVVVALDRAYLAGGDRGLLAVSVEEGSPIWVLDNPFRGLLATGCPGLTAVLAEDLGVQQVTLLIFDDSPTPRIIGSLPIATPPANAHALLLSEDCSFAVLALGTLGVWQVDLGLPTQPRVVDQREALGSSSDVAQGQTPSAFYVAEGFAGLRLIDFDDPANQWTAAFAGIPREVAAEGETIALLDATGRLAVVVDDGSGTPSLESSVPIGGFGLDIGIQDGLAALRMATATTESFELYDISNPAQPSFEASVYLGAPGASKGMSFEDRTIAIAADSAGVPLFDVSNPASPESTGSVEIPGDALGVSLRGTQIYVADAWTTVDVATIPEPTPTLLLVAGLGYLAALGRHRTQCWRAARPRWTR